MLLNFKLIEPVLASANSFVGNVQVPSGVPSTTARINPFISGIIRFIIVIAGLFALWNLLMGGLGMITGAGDKGKIQEAQNKIFMSVLGLVIIAASFLIIGIVSKLLFNDFTFILDPQIQQI